MNVPVRSGIVNAILEISIVLLVAPVWNKALTKVYNCHTFRRARKRGHGIRVGQQIPTLSDPFISVRSWVTGTKFLLVGEIALVIIIFWLELGVNGETESVYKPATKFVLNGGGFPTVAPKSNITSLQMISGLSAESRSCFRRVGNHTYELYAVAYNSPQNFERYVSQAYGFNDSICLDDDNTKQTVGVRFVGNYQRVIGEWDFNTQRFKKGKRIPQPLIEGYLRGTCEGSPYGRNTYTVLGAYTSGSRIMSTVIRKDENVVELEVGGLVNLEDNDSNSFGIEYEDYGTSTCAKLNYTRMTRREFSVTVTALNSRLDIENLARALTLYLDDKKSGVYRNYDAVDIMTQFFYSGEVDSDEDGEQIIGQFEQMKVLLRGEERNITVFDKSAVVTAAVVLAAVLGALVLSVLINNHGRDMTSVAWTLGVVRSHYEDLGRCWNGTPDATTYWVQKKDEGATHFGPKGCGTIVQRSDGVRNEDIL